MGNIKVKIFEDLAARQLEESVNCFLRCFSREIEQVLNISYAFQKIPSQSLEPKPPFSIYSCMVTYVERVLDEDEE